MPRAAGAEPADVVRSFLDDVRSGRHLERAGRYLAPVVIAHQGRPGAERGVVIRDPQEYARHVRDMERDVGPWTFTVEELRSDGDLVEATWRQVGRGVERGWARYRVAQGRISEYWIDATGGGGAMRAAGAPEILRYTAFSSDPRGGNPAGVVLDARDLPDAAMLAIAAEVGYSETAFLVERGDRFDVRYFSPLAEVSFCGHATIASAVAWAERHGAGDLRYDTAAGPVDVTTERAADGSWRATLTSVPPRTAELRAEDRRRLLDVLGWSEDDLDPALPPRVAFGGAWHPVLAARTRERLAALHYDMAALGGLMADRNWTTVDLVWRESDSVFHARNPFPPGGVVEDPATGAAAAALGGYLREMEAVDAPAMVTVRQGADMGRPSVLTVHIPAEPGSGIRVGGAASAID